jgi:hypothetical protein
MKARLTRAFFWADLTRQEAPNKSLLNTVNLKNWGKPKSLPPLHSYAALSFMQSMLRSLDHLGYIVLLVALLLYFLSE